MFALECAYTFAINLKASALICLGWCQVDKNQPPQQNLPIFKEMSQSHYPTKALLFIFPVISSFSFSPHFLYPCFH